MTDTDFPSISLMNDASNTSLSNFAGMELDKRRWRGNIWFDGAEAWSELNWIGKNIQVGEAVIKIAEPIVRCPATMSNPETGVKDVDTLRLLEGQFGHKHFGIYGTVVTGGRIALGDSISIQ